MRIKICKKEAKETIYWLKLLDLGSEHMLEVARADLIREAHELTRIFGAILIKAANSKD